MGLFQNIVLKKHLSTIGDKIAPAYKTYCEYFLNPEIQQNIIDCKEEEFQEGFLRALFVNVLGYTLKPEPNFNLIPEKKNESDSKKADGAIIIKGEVVGVIELKGTKTTDLKKIETQAFGYKNNNRNASYVVISNFEKLRFYIDNAVDYIEFNLFTLSLEEFHILWLCLSYENIAKGLPKQIKLESVSNEDQITNKLYRDYSTFKRQLYADLIKQNPKFDNLTLFKKSQKLLDRLLFILFAEDKGLLPANSINETVDKWVNYKNDPMNDYQPFYDRLKNYFRLLNVGHKDSRIEIFAYNGGLFKSDDVLDNIVISDDILSVNVLKLAKYDFDTEVDVNILGHIFENSLTEIEEVITEITTGVEAVSKRKKDGVFYTPRYITTYIVDNTLGKLCADKKIELQIKESEYFADKKRKIPTRKKLDLKLKDYREWLLSVTICDPACGSGAFLNAALDYLIKEHKLIDEMTAKILGGGFVFPNIENAILENNLFGVDINDESIEIAKLSLWLRTAKPHRKLNSLSNNIKCGNSLISDPEVAGDKAFDWELEFPHILANGGFDLVIGNPPYVDIKQLDSVLVQTLFKQYSTAENRINLYSIFIERGYELMKKDGYLSFIIPNSILMNSSYSKIRKLLLTDITEVVKLPDNVFVDAKVETIIFGIQKGNNVNTLNVLVYAKNEIIYDIDNSRKISVDKKNWATDYLFNIYTSKQHIEILNKIKSKGVPLVEYADFTLGITPYDKYQGHSEETITSRAYHSDEKIDESYKPLIGGGNVTRYSVSNKSQEYIKYGDWLGAQRDERFFTTPRIIIRQIVSGTPPRIYAGYTEESLYFTQIGFAIIAKNNLDNKYILTLINSQALNFYHKYSFLDIEKELFQKILIANCKCLPIPVISSNSQKPFIEMADKMLELNKELVGKRQKFLHRISEKFEGLKITGALERFDESEFKDFVAQLKKQKFALSLKEQDEWEEYFNDYKTECNTISTEITTTDNKIDQMVYALYNLTQKEIKLIEDSVNPQN